MKGHLFIIIFYLPPTREGHFFIILFYLPPTMEGQLFIISFIYRGLIVILATDLKNT